MRDGTGACGFGLRGSEAREAGPAQEGSRQRWCARSPEARPLRTTAELWQVHPKGNTVHLGMWKAYAVGWGFGARLRWLVHLPAFRLASV